MACSVERISAAKSFGWKRGADGDVSAAKGVGGVIDLRSGRIFQTGMADIANDPNDGAPLNVVLLRVDAAADGVAIGKVFLSKGLIDDYGLAGGRLGVGEGATGYKGNLHGREILRRDPAPFGHLILVVGIAIHLKHTEALGVA